MNEAELKEMSNKDLVQTAKDLGLNVTGKNPRSLVPLILKALDGHADEGEDSPETAGANGQQTGDTDNHEPTAEEIIAEEAGLLDGEDPDASPPNFDSMTEEEVLSHQITAAEAAKAHPAVLTALYNAYERLTAKPGPQPVTGPQDHPVVHTANQQHTGRPAKAGSHWPTAEEAISLLQNHVKRGMTVSKIRGTNMLLMKHGSREMAQTLKQPLRTILQHASLLMRPTGKPTEDLSYEELVDLRHKQIKK